SRSAVYIRFHSRSIAVTMMVTSTRISPILRYGLLISPATAEEECQESLLNNAPTNAAETAPNPPKVKYTPNDPSACSRRNCQRSPAALQLAFHIACL